MGGKNKLKKLPKVTSPKTRLRFDELLGNHSIGSLAKEMNITYTQLYPYKKAGANPTLLALEKLADGLSKLKGETVSVHDLLESKKKR